MGFRITTNMMVNTYRHNLMQSTNNLNDSRTKVETKRKFNSYAEDPAAATNAWRLRRAYWKNENYRASNTEAITRFEAAYSTMESIDDNLLNSSKGAFEAIKKADNDPEGGARVTLGQVLSELGDSIIYSMNGAKYSDHFVFAGNDEMNAPFRWSEDGKTLYYRNVNVNAGMVEKPTEPDPWANSTSEVPVDMPAAGDPNNTLTDEAWIAYYKDPATNSPPTADQPAWAGSPMVPKNMPDTGSDANEQDWIDYYSNGGTGTKPAGAEPSWSTAAATDGMVPRDMPDSSSDPIEQGWIDHYNDPANNPQPTAPEPDWGGMIPKDAYDMKNDPTATPTEVEQAWLDYHVDIAHGREVEEPEILAGEPQGWDLTTDPYGTPMNADGTYMTEADCATETEKAWLAYYRDQADVKKLEELAGEREIMDTGMGLQEISERELIDSTAFNRSLPGAMMLGYGVDEDGDPKNIVMIMKRLSELYSQCAEDGTFCDENGEQSDEVREEVYRLLDKFGIAHDSFNRQYTDIAARGEFLEANGERLEEQSYSLQEQIIDIEQVDMADAITAFMWDYNCYSAALKIGTQLLSQSLIDYMA